MGGKASSTDETLSLLSVGRPRDEKDEGVEREDEEGKRLKDVISRESA